MNNHGTTSIGLWVEFQSAVLRQLPRPEDAECTVFEGWLKNQESLKRVLAQSLLPPFSILQDINWPEAYKILGMEDEYKASVSGLVLPNRPDLWVMPMVKGVTSNKIVAGHKKLGVKFYLYADNLDQAVPKHDRDANRDGSYVVGFRRTIEADEENKNKSANQLVKENHIGITLPERLLLGAGFFVATGQHLDEKTWTLCMGSRDSDGHVPVVSWYSGNRGVRVYWCYPDGSDDYVRSRSVVS